MWKFGIFGKKKSADESPDDRTMIIAQLNARVQPLDRGEYFGDPLDEVLKSSGIGEVTGGGTLMADEPDGIKYCDIEIMVDDPSQGTIDKIIQTLEELGAPKGSFLIISLERDNIEFGRLEGMAVFLNGTDLPAEIYAKSDVNQIIASCDKLLEGIGSFRGHWAGSRETALYFYGSSFNAMRLATADFISDEPMCALARVVQIA